MPGPVPDPAAGPAPSGHAVFVQTDNTAGNQVVAYERAADGTLTPAGTYDTGGLGGVLTGSVVDHLASQGSLAYDQGNGSLYAVNAGSNTVSVFSVAGDHLWLRQVVGSGGTFPVSVAVHGDLVYVLNAENGGSVQGFYAAFGRLFPIPGSARPLGLNPTATPQFTNTPGQVAFSPNGSQLIVTTKANGSDIDVFGVGFRGYLSSHPVVNAEPGDGSLRRHLRCRRPPGGGRGRYRRPGHLRPPPERDGHIARPGAHRSDGDLLGGPGPGLPVRLQRRERLGQRLRRGPRRPTRPARSHDRPMPGTVDAAASPDGRFLYVQTGGNGIVDEFAVQATGSLTEVGSVTVPGAAGGEGIVGLLAVHRAGRHRQRSIGGGPGTVPAPPLGRAGPPSAQRSATARSRASASAGSSRRYGAPFSGRHHTGSWHRQPSARSTRLRTLVVAVTGNRSLIRT